MGYAKLACAVFAQFEILDVHAERLSTDYSRLICNGIGEPNGCVNPRVDDNDSSRCPLMSTTTTATTTAIAAAAAINTIH